MKTGVIQGRKLVEDKTHDGIIYAFDKVFVHIYDDKARSEIGQYYNIHSRLITPT